MPLSQRHTTMNAGDCGHFVDFFGHDDHMVAAAVSFLAEGFAAGSYCIGIFTHEHRERIEAGLRESGWNPQQLTDDYRLVMLGAHETLAIMWVDDRLDVSQFYKQFSELLRLMGAGGRSVRITGEIVRLLAEYGRFDAVIQLEELCNDLSREYTFRLYCLYCEASFVRPLEPAHRRRICAVHSGSLRVS